MNKNIKLKEPVGQTYAKAEHSQLIISLRVYLGAGWWPKENANYAD